jgi:chromate reductase
MTAPLDLVAIAGSLRVGSYNRALLRALPDLSPATLRYTVLDWSALPVFNEDLEADGLPQVVIDLQRAIRGSDGVVIAAPEYNHGVPGPLKNLIDWMSRGPMPHGFDGVPVALLGASSGVIGTTRSQSMLRQTFAALNAPVLPFPQVLVGPSSQRFDHEGNLTHEPTREFIAKWAIAVDAWMRRFPRDERR